MQKHIKSCQLNQDLADICTIGLDVGDRYSYLFVLDAVDTVVNDSRIRTTPVALAQYFSRLPRARVPLEAGTHSSWISRMLEDCGHFVIAGNAREVRNIHQSTRKNDRTDAQIFGRLARVDAAWLHPIRHRSAQRQVDLSMLRSRDALVRARTQFINIARGLAKTACARLPSCSAESFRTRAMSVSRLQHKGGQHLVSKLSPTRYPQARSGTYM